MEEIGEVNGDSNAHYGMGRVILEDSLEEEVTNCAIKSSESQHEGHRLLFLGVSPQHRWGCMLVSVRAHTHILSQGPDPTISSQPAAAP